MCSFSGQNCDSRKILRIRVMSNLYLFGAQSKCIVQADQRTNERAIEFTFVVGTDVSADVGVIQQYGEKYLPFFNR